MNKRFYLCLFNENTWEEFLAQKIKVYGTTKNKLVRANKITKDDYLICYVSKKSKFVGILQKTSDAYFDETPLWRKGVFPVRFAVKIILAVPITKGFPVIQLKNKISILQNIKNEKKWAGFFINSFNEFPANDGELIQKELEKITSQSSSNSDQLIGR